MSETGTRIGNNPWSKWGRVSSARYLDAYGQWTAHPNEQQEAARLAAQWEARQAARWVYDQCGDGHDPVEEGDGICWSRCARCGDIAYTPQHQAQAAWLDAQERARTEKAG